MTRWIGYLMIAMGVHFVADTFWTGVVAGTLIIGGMATVRDGE